MLPLAISNTSSFPEEAPGQASTHHASQAQDTGCRRTRSLMGRAMPSHQSHQPWTCSKTHMGGRALSTPAPTSAPGPCPASLLGLPTAWREVEQSVLIRLCTHSLVAIGLSHPEEGVNASDNVLLGSSGQGHIVLPQVAF